MNELKIKISEKFTYFMNCESQMENFQRSINHFEWFMQLKIGWNKRFQMKGPWFINEFTFHLLFIKFPPFYFSPCDEIIGMLWVFWNAIAVSLFCILDCAVSISPLWIDFKIMLCHIILVSNETLSLFLLFTFFVYLNLMKTGHKYLAYESYEKQLISG